MCVRGSFLRARQRKTKQNARAWGKMSDAGNRVKRLEAGLMLLPPPCTATATATAAVLSPGLLVLSAPALLCSTLLFSLSLSLSLSIYLFSFLPHSFTPCCCTSLSTSLPFGLSSPSLPLSLFPLPSLWPSPLPSLPLLPPVLPCPVGLVRSHCAPDRSRLI